MKFIRDEVALEAVQLSFVWVGILAFLTYRMFDVYFVSTVREVASRI